MDNIIAIFLEEASQAVESWEQTVLELESNPSTENVQLLFRIAHNLKGSSLSLGLKDFGNFIHKVEELITKIKNGALNITKDSISVFLEVESALRDWVENLPGNSNYKPDTTVLESRIAALADGEDIKAPAERAPEPEEDEGIVFNLEELAKLQRASEERVKIVEKSNNKKGAEEAVRVALSKLDTLLNFVGEVVLNYKFMERFREEGNLGTQVAEAALAQLGKAVNEVQDVALTLRMFPIAPHFQKMQRIVRDLSTSQGKEIQLNLVGQEVELDKMIVDALGDPLTHIIRNAVDHGIETPEEREASGKPRAARISLEAEQKESHVEIRISDDGRGLNKERLLKKAREKKLISFDQKLTDSEVHHLIFHSGFSTRDVVTDVSGRGVGMDVVKKAVEALKGSIAIRSEEGRGTTFILTLPLSLSIFKGLVVESNNERYVVPVTQLKEIVDLSRAKVESHMGREKIINLRGVLLPVRSLAELLGRRTTETEATKDHLPSLVTQSSTGQKMTIRVDRVLEEQSVVLKKLPHKLEGLPGITGATILKDGEPAIILNLSELLEARAAYAS